MSTVPKIESSAERKKLQEEVSTERQLLLDAFDNYVYNNLPTHLLRISDMTLVTRGEIWDMFQPKMKAVTDTDIEKALRSYEATRNPSNSRSFWGRVSRIFNPPEVREEFMVKWREGTIRRYLKYAIFSHRWDIGEPLFYELSSKRHGQKPTPVGLGYQKLVKFCEKAKKYGCEYVWSDTCCINKESSSELDEAIRSMYRWYQRAEVCIAYLAQSSSLEDFGREPWFTRGWTLQELLAPKRMRFYGKDWKPLCTSDDEDDEEDEGDEESPQSANDKDNHSILDAIGNVTGISRGDVQDFFPSCIGVPERMRWASKRKTTRIEDVAYSLMGIFDVSMPIAYGEGDRAFYRLLEVIAQESGKADFFAWAGEPSPWSLAFPSSPASYGKIDPEVTFTYHAFSGDSLYAITRRGLEIKVLTVPMELAHHSSDRSITFSRSIASTNLRTLPNWFRDRLEPNEFDKLAIVNFQQSGTDEGRLSAGEVYFGLLLGGPVDGAYMRLPTDRVLTFSPREDFQGQPERVCLAHAFMYLL
ncbi:hypothetical protein HYDPIDRAFT_34346 [Hydnomerulius pinastri MD-312]|uniref:Heterokaryon incompatibility domain-containing protein n=1 Tax=Hydnomerulius pinastri MD-312 TaxID=994086 RepID=A0A0C9VL25_9AGAM|nr:hypothetical protein HYDPIDRAFT_34346 [Hydnomerulius pinastri MD-312]